jgi:hypothetical protein
VTTTTGTPESNPEKERRGEVLDILRELLDERRDDDVVNLVSKLVAHNKRLPYIPHFLEGVLGNFRAPHRSPSGVG